MPGPLKLYDLAPSPNNIKVRCALAFKGLKYERILVDPGNREAVIKASGQPLSPVLLHGETVVFDSYAILRYLDANFRDTPRLYGSDRPTIKAVEQWELFARTDCGPAVSACFGQMREPSPDPAVLKRANEQMERAASRVEETLEKGEWLCGGNAPTAADFTVGTMLYTGAVTEKGVQSMPALAFFRKHLKIERAPKTLAWIARVMEYDR